MKDRKGSQFRSQSCGASFNRNRSQSGRAGFDRNRSQSGGAGFKFGGNGDRSVGGHQLVKLENLGEISDEDTVFYMEKKGIGANKKYIEKLHRVLNHKGVKI